MWNWILAAALALGLVSAAAAEPVAKPAGPTILISIDGGRADYLDRGVTPTLSALTKTGVRAAMRPSFPSLTFPNHYTLVTGLTPDHHGIVANNFIDARSRRSRSASATTRRCRTGAGGTAPSPSG